MVGGENFPSGRKAKTTAVILKNDRSGFAKRPQSFLRVSGTGGSGSEPKPFPPPHFQPLQPPLPLRVAAAGGEWLFGGKAPVARKMVAK